VERSVNAKHSIQFLDAAGGETAFEADHLGDDVTRD